MALVALELGMHPWDVGQLDGTRRLWLEQVSIWAVERQRERDQQMLEAIARIMGARR